MKKSVWKRSAVVLLLCVGLIGLIAGCSGNNSGNGGNTAPGTNSPSSGGNGQAADQPSSKSFKLWLGWQAVVNNDSLVQKYWRETEPGIDVQLEATQGDVLTSLNLKLSTDGFEDAAVFDKNETIRTSLVKSGKIMPLEQYFDMPDKYPNLASIPDVYLEQMKDKDGHIWAIPSWFDQNPDDPWAGWASYAWFARTDLLEQTGMSLDDLKTIEGIEQYLSKAAALKDDSGKSILPLGFLSDKLDERVILNTFGVKTATAGSGVLAAKPMADGSFVLQYDDPQMKTAFQWMNKMYRDGLIDMEVVTDKSERYKEKNKSGRYAMNAGSFWEMDQHVWDTLDGPTEPGWYYQVIPYPTVAGVDEVGVNTLIDPAPSYYMYVSKDTKNLDAILTFMDYTLNPDPIQQQIVNEGPVGLYWGWVNEPNSTWHYIDDAYQAERESGDSARKSAVTPELWQLASYSKEWYPWWNNVMANEGGYKTNEFSSVIGNYGAVKSVEAYDTVPAKDGGLIQRYLGELNNVYTEYKAKLLMAKSDKVFEDTWNSFQDALEKRAHWSELRDEWHATYQEMTQGSGAN